MFRKQFRFAQALPDSPYVDATPVRQEIRLIAQRLLSLDYNLSDVPRTASDLESVLRHADLPFALDAYLREQLSRTGTEVQ